MRELFTFYIIYFSISFIQETLIEFYYFWSSTGIYWTKQSFSWWSFQATGCLKFYVENLYNFWNGGEGEI